MGRAKEFRQRLKYQLASVREKSMTNQIQVELKENLGISPAEAELLAEKICLHLSDTSNLRNPNQIIIAGAKSRLSYARGRRTGDKKVLITPFHYEDLEVEWEFGLAKMQENRLLRVIEEAWEQNSLLAAKNLCLLLNITVNSLSQRLDRIRNKGIYVPTMGMRKKQRANEGICRATWLLKAYFEGEDLSRARKEIAIPSSKFREIITRFRTVLNEIVSGTFKEYSLKEAEWAKLIEELPTKKLEAFLEDYWAPEEQKPRASFSEQLVDDFNYSPILIRAINNFVEELKRDMFNNRESTQAIYWAVAAGEPAGKPLSECRLIPVKVTLLSREELALKGDIKRLKEVKLAKIIRYSNEAKVAGGYLNQADLSFLLGIHTDAIRRLIEGNYGVAIPLRGSECDIGRGMTHKEKIIGLYLQMYTETEIVERTGHSYESIENYIKEFATVFALHERGLPPAMIRKVTGRSLQLIKTYLDLIHKYSAPEYSMRFLQLRRVFLKEERKPQKRGLKKK